MFKNPTIREFFIIDGHSQIHRAYHSPFTPLSCRCSDCLGKSSEGCNTCAGTGQEPTKATFVFTKFLIKALQQHKPYYVVMAMDGPREKLHRRKLYEGYKAHRETETPVDFLPQLRRIEEIVRALGIPVVRIPGWEADDVIATFVDAMQPLDDVYCTIVGRDKDLMQLIGPNVRMYDPMAEAYLDGRFVLQKFGVYPHQLIDYQALVGDSSDNVPGVKGIGPAGATALLTKYPTIKALTEAEIGTDKKLDRLLKLIRKQQEQHLLSRSLVTLRRDLPLPRDLTVKGLRWRGVDMARVRPIFRLLNFKKWE